MHILMSTKGRDLKIKCAAELSPKRETKHKSERLAKQEGKWIIEGYLKQEGNNDDSNKSNLHSVIQH